MLDGVGRGGGTQPTVGQNSQTVKIRFGNQISVCKSRNGQQDEMGGRGSGALGVKEDNLH